MPPLTFPTTLLPTLRGHAGPGAGRHFLHPVHEQYLQHDRAAPFDPDLGWSGAPGRLVRYVRSWEPSGRPPPFLQLSLISQSSCQWPFCIYTCLRRQTSLPSFTKVVARRTAMATGCTGAPRTSTTSGALVARINPAGPSSPTTMCVRTVHPRCCCAFFLSLRVVTFLSIF